MNDFAREESAGGPIDQAEATSPLIVLVAADKGGAGKAQTLQSLIATPHGWRQMGQMRVGMPICGTDGKTYSVSGVFPRGVLPAYRVTFTDGTSVECSADHLWTTKNIYNWKRDGWQVKTTADLMKSKLYNRNTQSYAYSIPMIEPLEFVGSIMPMDAYTLGVLIGDGSLTQSTVAFSVPSMKEGIKQKVTGLLNFDHHLTGPHGNEAAPQWHICGGKRRETTMSAQIKKFGLNCRSGQRFIPEIYKTASVSDRLELLRGLMDTDGSAKAGRTSFSTTSQRLANDVADLVRSLGGIAIIHQYDRRAESKPIEFNVNVRMTICPFSLDYKVAGWIPAGQNKGKYFKSIEPIGDLPMQCISTTAPDHLYVTDGYNATHNSTVARALMDYLEKYRVRVRPFDTETGIPVFKRFYPDAEVLSPDTVAGQMAVVDSASAKAVTVIDCRAGLLSPIVKAFHKIKLMDDVRAGDLRLLLLHVIGPTVASSQEIAPIMDALRAANVVRVNNVANPDATFEPATDKQVVVTIPYLPEEAAEAVDRTGSTFSAFMGNPKNSRTLRGYVADWLERVFAEFDRIGLPGMILPEKR